MKKKTKKRIIAILVNLGVILIFFGGIIIGYLYKDLEGMDYFSSIENINSETNITELCYNETFTEKINCMVTYVRSIYKYEETDDSMDLELEELKLRGGDCKDWSELFFSMAKELNMTARKVQFSTNKTAKIGHQITIVSDEFNYCILDQRIKPICVKINTQSQENRHSP